jgi:cell division protein FtsW
MTEMVHGPVLARSSDPVLPRWWRTIDKWTMSCILALFGIGLLLGLAASPPLASRNGLDPFHYVQRQAFFGGVALAVMLLVSMLDPKQVRRLAVIGFGASFVALTLLPVLGTDFGKGAVRWYSLGFASFQPSEFLKPGFVVLCAWLLAAAHERNGPPGRLWSFGLAVLIVAMLAFQPDFGQAALVLFSWGVMYFVAGAPMMLLADPGGGGRVHRDRGLRELGALRPAHRRVPEPGCRSAHAAWLRDQRDPRGGLLAWAWARGEVKWSLPDAHTDFIIAVAAEEYGFVLVLAIIGLYALIGWARFGG